jgi:hypothetical protein
MEIDFSRLRFSPVACRQHLASTDGAGEVILSSGVAAFLKALPDHYGARDLNRLVQALREAFEAKKMVLWGMGGHGIKVGVLPYLLRLQEAGIVSAFAVNGSCMVHDFELAFAGQTSEDVAAAIATGDFGMPLETASQFAKALQGLREGEGLGEVWGRWIEEHDFPHSKGSLFASGYRRGVPVTVHPALGTDVIHYHPDLDWSLLGRAAQVDFRRFCERVGDLGGGGVYVNMGSAVLLPEVFLKAVSIVRNLGADLSRFTTANLDQIQHYRPRANVLVRPGGDGIALTGQHEILVPLIATALLEAVALKEG